MIVTLAGHVDHGKTSLVRSLTGTDTDRLAEEKARGLTIDLGFAYQELDGTRIGFVDVPGHHRFIHNMVAGVASNQFALLAVAADDGPMPQTREHLEILTLTGVRTGVVALTKCDRVNDDRLGEAEEEIRALTAGSFLDGADIVRTSATDGAGIDRLATHLVAAARNHATGTRRERLFRLPIDRAFTIRGSGLVVTGTIHSGTIAEGDACTVYPAQLGTRVRGLRVQDTKAERALPGDRAAINLSGAESAQVQRGHWLGAPGLTNSRTVTVELAVAASFPRNVRHWTPVHVYHATTHSTGRVALLESSSLAPGDQQLADLVCDAPLLACHGDAIILRDQSLDLTLGGGRVIAVEPAEARRRTRRRLQRLKALSTATLEAAYEGWLEVEPVPLERLGDLWSLPPETVEALPSRRNDRLVAGHAVTSDQWQQWRDAALTRLQTALKENPDLPGLKVSDFALPFPEPVLADLRADKKLELKDGFARLPSHAQKLPKELADLLSKVKAPLDARQPPSVGDLSKQLRIPIPKLQKGLTQIANQKQLIKISDQRFFLPDHWEALVAIVRELAAAGPFNVREFRDAAGIGRNIAIDVLEYLDGRGITMRQGDQRIVRPGR